MQPNKTKYNWLIYSDRGLLEYIDFINRSKKISEEEKQELLQDIKSEQENRKWNLKSHLT